MNSSQRNRFEKFLLAERKRHEGTLARVAGSLEDTPDDRGRPGDDMTFSSSGASPDDDRAVVANATRELVSIDRALERLRNDPKHFGLCSACSRPIPMERLHLVPGAVFCQSHAFD